MMGDVFVRYAAGLPPSIKGAVRLDHDGNYNVYLNPVYSDDTLRRTLEHELTHIRRGDLERDGLVDRMEVTADATG